MTDRAVSSLGLAAGFAAVYLIWGSTYLAIRIGVETMPPLLMSGARFVIAGGVLHLFLLARGGRRPSLIHWGNAALVGAMLLLVANGGVAWAELYIPSGMAALLVATLPMWMVVIEAIRPGGTRPTRVVVVGLMLGFAGVALLLGPGDLLPGDRPIPLIPCLALLGASFSWALGSIYSRGAELPESPLMATSLQMLTGGILLLLAGTALGEWNGFDVRLVAPASWTAVAYLIVFGSLVAFSSYVWLLRVAPPARVSTYAYVNPVIAVFLGWVIGGENLTPRILLAAAVIVFAVFLIIRGGVPRPPARPDKEKSRLDEPGFTLAKDEDARRAPSPQRT